MRFWLRLANDSPVYVYAYQGINHLAVAPQIESGFWINGPVANSQVELARKALRTKRPRMTHTRERGVIPISAGFSDRRERIKISAQLIDFMDTWTVRSKIATPIFIKLGMLIRAGALSV